MDTGIFLKFTFWIEVIFAFGFMVFIHEGGHFLACRLFGVEVDEFCLGFPPRLISRKWGKTLYSIGVVPLGGFCKPRGGDLSGDSPEKMYEKPAKRGDFLFASWWKRVFIFLAGPGMNYLSAFTFLFFLFWAVGEETPIEKTILSFVPPSSSAGQAGVQKGDKVLKVDGEAVTNLFKVRETLIDDLTKNPSQGVTLSLERGGQVVDKILKGDVQRPDFDTGLYDASIPAVAGSVNFSSPARKAGMKDGDKVLTVNGQKVSDWSELHYVLENSPTDEVHLEIEREGKTYPINLKRIYDGMGKHIGIGPIKPADYEVKRLGFGEAFSGAAFKTADLTRLFLGSLWELARGKISLMDNLSGPVTIMRLMYQRASQGLVELFNIVAFISLVLCLMNLLPIPVVDGGQIVLCFIEGIKRKPVSVKIQLAYQQVGFFLVIGLMGVAVFNDVWGFILEKFHSQFH